MADDSEFLPRLMSFGLSEKEAQTYLHLLKYGPKPPTLLAKSLKTYREDVHRTLSSLIDKGMVNPSLDSPTVYSAVELEIALDVALKRHETGLRDMEVKRQELVKLSQQQRFRPSDEFSTFKIIKSIKELIAIGVPTVNSLEKDYLLVCPPLFLAVALLYGGEDLKKFIDRGGEHKVITDVSYPYIETVQQHVDMGSDVRHFHEYRGIMFGVLDRKIGVSAINLNLTSTSLDQPIGALWTDDPDYANYLISTFELLWEQAVPATRRIEELLKEGPPKA